MTDLELLEAIDGHDAPCNSYEASRVERLLKWVRPGKNRVLRPGKPLTLKDRKWAADLLDQLNSRR